MDFADESQGRAGAGRARVMVTCVLTLFIQPFIYLLCLFSLYNTFHNENVKKEKDTSGHWILQGRELLKHIFKATAPGNSIWRPRNLHVN